MPRKFSAIPAEKTNKERLVVLGNSFTRDFINMLLEYDLDRKYEIVYDDLGCAVSDQRLEQLLHNSRYVVLANNWVSGADAVTVHESLSICVEDLSNRIHDRKLFVLGAKNFGWNNNFVKMLPTEKLTAAKTRPLSNIDRFNTKAAKGIDGYVDMLSLLKDSSGEVPVFSDEGKFITYDTDHLTKNGAKYLGAIVFEKTELAILNK